MFLYRNIEALPRIIVAVEKQYVIPTAFPRKQSFAEAPKYCIIRTSSVLSDSNFSTCNLISIYVLYHRICTPALDFINNLARFSLMMALIRRNVLGQLLHEYVPFT